MRDTEIGDIKPANAPGQRTHGRQQVTIQKKQAVLVAVKQLLSEGTDITHLTVARRAGVSPSFTYRHNELREAIKKNADLQKTKNPPNFQKTESETDATTDSVISELVAKDNLASHEEMQPNTLFEVSSPSKRTQGGVATSEVLMSAHQGGNADLFPRILELFIPDGSRIADVTYGNGVFWSKVTPGRYELLATDISMGIDCRALPYPDSYLDALVLDPPYMEGLLRDNVNHKAGNGSHSSFREYYSNGNESSSQWERPDGKPAPKWHAAVRDLYYYAALEAWRTLRPGGVFIVKCQDEVSANKQWLTHVEIINDCSRIGFYCKDLFVLMRNNKAGISRVKKQVHARKNHSYFLVFIKPEFKMKRSR